MSAPSRFFYTFEPDLPDLSKRERQELLEEIGDYLKVAILDMVGDSVSPVSGSPDFRNKKNGEPSILDNEGDLLDALDFRINRSATSIDIGFFSKDQAAKAYGHATRMEGHPWLENKVPRRQIIPLEDQVFKREIKSGIKMIIEDFLDANQSED